MTKLYLISNGSTGYIIPTWTIILVVVTLLLVGYEIGHCISSKRIYKLENEISELHKTLDSVEKA